MNRSIDKARRVLRTALVIGLLTLVSAQVGEVITAGLEELQSTASVLLNEAIESGDAVVARRRTP